MPKTTKADLPLLKLLAASERPIYAIDAERRIVYCNPALEAWLELPADRIVGRLVEYRSDPAAEHRSPRDAAGPLSDLCPPPRAFYGEPTGGTVSCLERDGRLVHRHAQFIPLHVGEALRDSQAARRGKQSPGGVLALLAASNLTADELAAEVGGEPTTDELHRTIRRFRRAQAGRYGLASILGSSSAMRKVRSQIVAAAASGANVLVCGRAGTGRASIGRAIHYHAVGDAAVKLVPIDGMLLTDDALRRALDAVSSPPVDGSRRPTLLIENVERISQSHQAQLVEAIRRNSIAARIVATTTQPPASSDNSAPDEVEAPEPESTIDASLRDALSTITIDVPRLADRRDDLPLVAQFFLEAANRGNVKQVGSVRPEALDLLALYTWPGELDEMRQVLAAAHRAAATHTIGPADLPPVIHHAVKAAALPRRAPERIVLDDLLTTIEKEAIVRALAQAGGNKSEAAELLGLTRPRLYRRMEQLGLAPPTPGEPAPKFKEVSLPDFREVEPEEPSA
jgi:DNA-binding NtrC family response regulator